MTRRLVASCGLVVGLTVFLHAGQVIQAAESLPPWTPGTLDIHQISTGVGNSALVVFPDGTTLLVDAGDASGSPANVRRPDDTRGAGEWIARYARHTLQHDANPAIDYALITHLHGDHMGRITPDSPTGRHGYKLSGLSEVAEFIPIRRVLDRGWPDYVYPSEVPYIEEYRKFLFWQSENGSLGVERFEAGRSDQIALVRDAARYRNVEVRNIVVNGEVWTGVGTATRSLFPPLQTLQADDYPPENSCSAAIRISYGPFTFYTGGDLTGEPQPGGPPWTDVETAIAPIVGAVDVAVLNHHGMWDASNETFLRALRPRVIVIPASNPPHPDHDTAIRITSTRIYPGPHDIFATGVLPATQTVVGASLRQFTSTRGHVVVRVAPGGASYRVFVLDDTTESFAITGVFGPYQSQ
jgi:beta-lactamase superfamily II metal-dependent hydrolase